MKVPDQIVLVDLGILTVSLGIFPWARSDLGLAHSPLHRTSSGYLMGGLGLFTLGILNGSLTSESCLFVPCVGYHGLAWITGVPTRIPWCWSDCIGMAAGTDLGVVGRMSLEVVAGHVIGLGTGRIWWCALDCHRRQSLDQRYICRHYCAGRHKLKRHKPMFI